MPYTAKQIFDICCKGRNVMTPKVLSRGKLTAFIAWELSEGTGFNHEPIWGVTVRKITHAGAPDVLSPVTKLGQLFRTHTQARNYISTLKQKALDNTLMLPDEDEDEEEEETE